MNNIHEKIKESKLGSSIYLYYIYVCVLLKTKISFYFCFNWTKCHIFIICMCNGALKYAHSMGQLNEALNPIVFVVRVLRLFSQSCSGRTYIIKTTVTTHRSNFLLPPDSGFYPLTLNSLKTYISNCMCTKITSIP